MSEQAVDTRDTALQHELREWTAGITRNLCAAFTPPVDRLCGRILQSMSTVDAIDSTDDVFANLTTMHHPIQALPRMPALPPLEMPHPLPHRSEEVDGYVKQWQFYLTQHDANIAGYSGQAEDNRTVIDRLAAELRALADSGNYDYDWGSYNRAHAAQHARDFCSLSYEAIRLAVTKHGPSDFVRLEQELIVEHLPQQHETYLTQNTSSLLRQAAHVRAAIGENEDFALRLVRAGAFIVDWMEQDPVFQADLERQTALYRDTIRKHVLRAHGTQFPNDPQVMLHTCQEAVAVALVTQVRLLMEGHEENPPRLRPYLVGRRLVARSTAIAPIGLVGPAQFQNRSFENPMLEFPLTAHEPQLTKEVRHMLSAMNSRWLREIDYPAWAAYHAKLMAGHTDVQPPVRTGVMCPAILSYTDPETGIVYPDAITSLTRVLLDLTDCIEPSLSPIHTRYRPWEIPQFVDSKSGLLAQQWLGRAATELVA